MGGPVKEAGKRKITEAGKVKSGEMQFNDASRNR